MVSTPIPWRKIVIEQLQMLASESEQLAYEKNVPHVDVTAELVCGWFDDSYHPDSPQFRSCFTETELGALEEFDAVFESHRAALPPSKGTVTCWLASSAWRKVMDAASETVHQIAA